MGLLSPSDDLLERILGMGGEGTGKSTAWLQIALRLRASGSPARLHVIDTDSATERMLKASTSPFYGLHSDSGGNVTTYPAYEWGNYKTHLDVILRTVQRVDWVVVDMVDESWGSAQDWYSETKYGLDKADLFATKGSKEVTEESDFWQVVSPVYKAWEKKLIHKIPCHLFAVTTVKEVGKKEKDKMTRMVYGELGVKPAGHPKIGHKFHTVLLFGHPTRDSFTLTTAKDRVRNTLAGVMWSDFPTTYLCGPANWRDDSVSLDGLAKLQAMRQS